MKGYKVFNPDWTCRGFQFEVGKIFEEDVVPSCCHTGFHFCTKASDCFNYYSFDSNNKVAEVEAIGDIDTNDKDSKCCTNKIKIVREVSWNEVLNLVNEGRNCTGYRNTGNYNTGYRNTGYYNTGYRNTGYYNTGNYNTGNYNTGYRNTGYYNTGNGNTGDWNTGNGNTGDWNKSSFNTGCFNTEEQKIILFNKQSDMTYRDWINSDARSLLCTMQNNVVEWVYESDMTEEEKNNNPTYKTTGGYLKVIDESECRQTWWDNLSISEKEIIKGIQNFDADIFKAITGIDTKE